MAGVDGIRLGMPVGVGTAGMEAGMQAGIIRGVTMALVTGVDRIGDGALLTVTILGEVSPDIEVIIAPIPIMATEC